MLSVTMTTTMGMGITLITEGVSCLQTEVMIVEDQQARIAESRAAQTTDMVERDVALTMAMVQIPAPRFKLEEASIMGETEVLATADITEPDIGAWKIGLNQTLESKHGLLSHEGKELCRLHKGKALCRHHERRGLCHPHEGRGMSRPHKRDRSVSPPRRDRSVSPP